MSKNIFQRRVDDIFQYCGSLPLNSSDAKIKEITIGRKRTADSLKEKVVTSLTTIENKLHRYRTRFKLVCRIKISSEKLIIFSPKPERKKVKNTNDTSLIFDITHEEIKNKKQVDDISLNGAKLIREQLNISENSKIKFYFIRS